MAGKLGIEPRTARLTAGCSAAELHAIYWCRHKDLNPGPSAYKAAALPAELWRRRKRPGPTAIPGKALGSAETR